MFRILSFLTFLLSGCGGSGHTSAPATQPATNQNQSRMSFYQVKSLSLSGEPFSFEQLKGKIVVVLNVASECGYTPQYADWQKFYEQNSDGGIVVIGVPCNQFGGQEPDDASTIASFCQKNYGVTFPMLEKQNVKGGQKSELYQFLTDPAMNGWNKSEPTWNFCKYVINREGKLEHFFESKVTPASESWIEAMSKMK